MRGKGDVVEGYGWGVPIVTSGVLRADVGTVVESEVGDKVGEEAQAVDEWEVDGGARGRAPAIVEDGLWVEGERPAEGVDPAEEGRQDVEEAEHHVGGIVYV